MIQCKLCGASLKEENIEAHRLNHHNWFQGDTIARSSS